MVFTNLYIDIWYRVISVYYYDCGVLFLYIELQQNYLISVVTVISMQIISYAASIVPPDSSSKLAHLHFI